MTIKQEKEEQDIKDYFKKIIIYIHGGAYMALSSAHMQPFTRLFSNECEAPIFSIDYRLAPQIQYPENIHDCITGYFWILEFVRKVMGVEPETILLIGDSAGGSMSASLIIWLIENNQRVPDFYQPCYATLNLDLRIYTKSKYVMLEEKLLHLSAARAIQRFYIPKDINMDQDYYLNPLLVPDEILKKFPPTRLLTCLLDPLRDDQLIFARRMQKLELDVELNCFDEMQHGMLTVFQKELPLAEIIREILINQVRNLFYGEDILNSEQLIKKVGNPRVRVKGSS